MAVDRMRRAGKRSRCTKRPTRRTKRCGSPTTSRTRLARNPKDRVAVLYRTNSQSRQIEEALRRYGRKYIVVGGFSFYQRAEVKDVLAYLKVLVSPQDSISLLRIINTPARGIGRTTMEQIEQYASATRTCRCGRRWGRCSRSAFSQGAPKRPCGVPPDDQELASQVDTRPISETLRDVMERPAIARCWKRKIPRNREDAAGESGRTAERRGGCGGARRDAFAIFWITRRWSPTPIPTDERAPVSLLTMHNAKGLEFPVVFIAGLEEGLFPHSRSLDSEARWKRSGASATSA